MPTPALSYETSGRRSTPPIVFLHGFMGNAADWTAVVSLLSPTHYCVSIDLPGHGGSLNMRGEDDAAMPYSLDAAADGVVAIMREEAVMSPVVVGYSMGGRVALHLAVRYPKICSGLVIMSATPGIADSEAREDRRKADRQLARELESEGLDRFLQRWYRQSLFSTIARSPGTLQALIRRRSQNRPTELAKALTGMGVGEQRPLWAALPGLNIPVLLLAGQEDAKYVDIVRAMGTSLPDSRVEILPGCGHAVHLEDPSAVAQRIKEFHCRPDHAVGSDDAVVPDTM